jgi:DHA1 family bicyclomycin/chloramphenicol resistance-like MFS transporter
MTHPTRSAERRSTTLIPFLGALSAMGPLSNDLFVPSLPLVAAGLAASAGSVQLTMSAVLIGFAMGQLLYGPLSDRFGRKPLLCIGLAVFVAGCLLCANSGSLNGLVISRALQGLGAAAGMVLSRAIILDRWRGNQASRALSWVAAFSFMVPVLAPLAGGYLALLSHWQLVFWIQAGIGALCLLAAATLLTRVRREQSGSSVVRSFTAYGRVLRDPEALAYMACIGFGFAGLMAFVSNSSFVFIGYFGLEPHQFGYCFAFVMLGGSLGSYVNGRLVTKIGISRLLSAGTVLLVAAGMVALLANLFVETPWAVLLPCLAYVFGIAFVLSNSIARVLSRFPEMAGAASAVFGVNQFLIGALTAAALSLNERPSALPLAGTLAVAGIGSAAVWWGWLRHRPTGLE